MTLLQTATPEAAVLPFGTYYWQLLALQRLLLGQNDQLRAEHLDVRG